MSEKYFEIESPTLFSESLIWTFNRNFYLEKGVDAWSDDIVPHHLTSNARVGKTYAELIFGLLNDLARQGNNEETVYLLELGAGHGRLAFHILRHLEALVSATAEKLPPYCYVLSDIVEENLLFFHNHPQLRPFFERGVLDLAYFDALNSTKLYLRHAQEKIAPGQLAQPILAIANYFFDSLPSDLFFAQGENLATCSVSINASADPDGLDAESIIENMVLDFQRSAEQLPVYPEPIQNELLAAYRNQFSETYLFFPAKAMSCLQNLRQLSVAGLAVLSMDKGFHELHDLSNQKRPDVVKHGSFSLWVNYHALNAFCERLGGRTLFPKYSSFHLEMGCLLFLPEGNTYRYTQAAYQRYVDDFGPDDFNSIKQLAYANLGRMSLKDLLALYRLSCYDATFFIKLLPRLKHVYKKITFEERRRLVQTLERVWQTYFNINEQFDLAYEIGGMLYNLGNYTEALGYFRDSVGSFGVKADVYYNQILCYYQLKDDDRFRLVLAEAKRAFPEFEAFHELEKLELD